MSERLKNPYGCMICHKSFSVSLHLVKHVELKHSSPNQPPIKPLIKVEPKDQDFDKRNSNTDENKVIPKHSICIRTVSSSLPLSIQQHAPYTQFLPRPVTNVSNVPKRKNS